MGYSRLTMVWQFQVNSEETRPYICMGPFSPKLPSHPGCHITLKQSSLCYTVGPCWLSILNILVCTRPFQAPWQSLPLATISWFSSLRISFCFASKFICIVWSFIFTYMGVQSHKFSSKCCFSNIIWAPTLTIFVNIVSRYSLISILVPFVTLKSKFHLRILV